MLNCSCIITLLSHYHAYDANPYLTIGGSISVTQGSVLSPIAFYVYIG